MSPDCLIMASQWGKMKKYFVLIGLFFATLCYAECEVTQANSEAEGSSIVEGVNVITGSYSFTVPVHHVPGAQPLTFYKSFNSHDYRDPRRPFWSESFYGFLCVTKGKIKKKDHTHALYVEDGGGSTFLIEPSKKKNLCLKLSHEYSPTRGVTNTSRGIIGASTNLSNMTLEMKEGRKDSRAFLTKPDGTLQNFIRCGNFQDDYFYRLEDQIFPNGNRYQCQYNDKNQRMATTFTNADQSTLFLKEHYEFTSYDKKEDMHYADHVFSDGNRSAQAIERCVGRYRGIKDPYYCLKWVQPIGAPKETYYYENRGLANWAQFKARYRPDTRYTILSYYEAGSNWVPDKLVALDETAPQIGRIRLLWAPAGCNKDPIPIYSFDYHIEKKSKKSDILLATKIFSFTKTIRKMY